MYFVETFENSEWTERFRSEYLDVAQYVAHQLTNCRVEDWQGNSYQSSPNLPAYENVASSPYGMDVDDLMKAYIHSDLKPPSKGKRMSWEYDGKLDIPIVKPPKVREKSVIDALEKITSRDELRPALCHILQDSGKMVATNANILVAVDVKGKKRKHIPSKWATKKGIELTKEDREFPDWECVIPKPGKTKDVKLSDLLEISYSCVQAFQWFSNPSGIAVQLIGEYGPVYVHHQLLNDLVKTMIELGEENVTIQLGEANRAVVFRGKKTLGLIMPVWMGSDYSQPWVECKI